MVLGNERIVKGGIMEDTTFCKWCSEDTDLVGIEECDRCYELRSRIEKDPDLAETILVAMDELK